MKPSPYRLLILDAFPPAAERVIDLLRNTAGFSFYVRQAASPDALREALQTQIWDVILCDFGLPSPGPAEALRAVQTVRRPPPVIVLYETAEVQDAVKMMRLGAADFVPKHDGPRLIQAVTTVLGIHPAEGSLAQRGHLYEILDTMEEAIMALSLPDRRILYVSASFENVLGHPMKRFLEDQDFFRQVVHPDDLARATEAMETCLRQGYAELDHRITLPDGTVRWLRRRAWVSYDAEGRPCRLIDATRDITDRKRLEKTLRANERRLRDLLENMRDVVWSATFPDFQVIYINPAARGVCGVPETTFYEDNTLWAKLIHPEDAHRMADFEQTLLKTGNRDVEYRILRPDGGVRWVRDRAWLVKNEVGQPVRAEGVAADITDWKLALEAVRVSEHKLRLFVEYAPAAIAMLDKNMVYLAASQRWLSDYRLEERDVVGHSHYEIFPEIPERWRQIHRRCLAGAVEKCDADPFPRADGRLDWVRWEIHPWREPSGEIGGILIFSEVITARIEAEQALRASEETLRLLAENMADVIWILDAATQRFTYVSPSVEALRGYTVEEVMAQPMEQVVTPDSLARIVNMLPPRIAAFIAGDPAAVIQRHEVEQTRKDGSTVWTEVVTRLLTDAAGNLQVLGVSRDISERKQAEAALREAHDLLEQRVIERTAELERAKDRIEAIVDHSGDGIVLLDLEHGIQLANRRFQAMFGLADDSCLGRPLASCFSPDSAGALDAAIREVIDTRQVRQVEFHVDPPSGPGLDVEISIAPISRSDRLVNSLVCMIHDITARRQAEDAIRESEARYRLLAENIKDVIVKISPDGKFTFVTPSSYELTRHRPEELIGTPVMATVHPDDVAGATAVTEQAISSGASFFSLQQRIAHKDGRYVWVEVNNTIVRDTATGAPLEMIGILHDITARKLAEDAIRESEARYRLLAENIKDVIVKVSMDGIRTFVTPSCYDMLGYLPEELIGRPGFEIVHPDDLAPTQLAIRQALASNTPYFTVTQRIRHREGHYIWVETASTLLRDSKTGRAVEILGVVHDITERKQAEDAIRESEARYRLLAENVKDVITRLSPAGIITFVTPSIYQLLGYRPEEATGTLGFDAVHPDDVSNSLAVVQHSLATRAPYFTLTERLQHKDGHYVWVEVTNTNVYDPVTGAPIEMVGVLRDITERKRAEQFIRESEARYRLLAENLRDVIVKLSPEGIITFATPSMFNLTGHHPAEVIGCVGRSFVHPDDAVFSKTIVDSALATRAPYFTLTERLQHKDGHYVWVEVTNTNVYDPVTGAPIEMVGVLRDITERRQAEAALRQSEEKFRSFIEAAPVAILISDQQGRIRLVNKEAERVFGYDRQALIGESIDILVPESQRIDHASLRTSFIALSERRRAMAMELNARRRDGTVLPVDIQLSFIDSPDGPTVMSYVLDITQQKQAENVLKQALEREKELGELKSRFVSMSSHEFRTPLASILATTETLTHYRERMTSPQIDERLGRIRQQVNHMKDVMEDVLQLARMQAGRVRFQPERQDVNLVCLEVVEELHSEPAYRDRIVYDSPNVPVIGQFDLRLLRQVIGNLAHNALKYSPSGNPVHMSLRQTDLEVTLRVTDKGIGIPPEDLKRLFEPFHRAVNVGTIAGTGLGLSIARQGVELHGGTIHVESQVGAGTTVTVVLPKLAPKQEAALESAPVSPA